MNVSLCGTESMHFLLLQNFLLQNFLLQNFSGTLSGRGAKPNKALSSLELWCKRNFVIFFRNLKLFKMCVIPRHSIMLFLQQAVFGLPHEGTFSVSLWQRTVIGALSVVETSSNATTKMIFSFTIRFFQFEQKDQMSLF